MVIRYGVKEDINSIMQIMNFYIEHTTIIFDKNPKSLAEMDDWYKKFDGSYPLLVAEMENEVVGYASLSSYRPKEAYKHTVELSIYISPHFQNNGIGKELMTAIIEEGKRKEFHTILSFITTENEGSIRFHEKFDFIQVGKLKEVGNKGSKWLDVSIYQIHLS